MQSVSLKGRLPLRLSDSIQAVPLQHGTPQTEPGAVYSLIALGCLPRQHGHAGNRMRRPLLLTLTVLGLFVSPWASAQDARSLEHGTASYYADKFNGLRTASGERYDPEEHTAAHRTLPFGSRVKVTNPNTGRSVIVRINDRGPFVKGRVIDLSRAAARLIGLNGLLAVVLGPADSAVQTEKHRATADTITPERAPMTRVSWTPAGADGAWPLTPPAQAVPSEPLEP
jgi:rare lipoprotein A (peptidoglycan hydrolase)